MTTVAQHPPTGSRARTVRLASGERAVTMSLDDPELAGDLDTLRQQVSQDRASAKRFLISVGIMNRSGKTAKSFGG